MTDSSPATAACDAVRDLPLQRGKRYVLACIRRPGHKGKHLDPLSNCEWSNR